MTPKERYQVEAAYREHVNPRLVLTRCAVGLLVIVAIAVGGIFTGSPEDPLHAAFTERPVASDR